MTLQVNAIKVEAVDPESASNHPSTPERGRTARQKPRRRPLIAAAKQKYAASAIGSDHTITENSVEGDANALTLPTSRSVECTKADIRRHGTKGQASAMNLIMSSERLTCYSAPDSRSRTVNPVHVCVPGQAGGDVQERPWKAGWLAMRGS